MMLLSALLVPLGARAQSSTLTVADGTSTNDYLPVYGSWIDAAQHNQMLYPVSLIGSLAGDSITGIGFYMSSQNSTAWGTTMTISLAEVADDQLSAINTTATLTQVWSGTVNGQADSLWFDFTTAFDYHGGNLLVDITTTAASWNGASFYGVALTNASIYSYNSNVYTQNFLPKAKFSHVEGDFSFCPPAGDMTVVPDTTSALITWTGTAASYEMTLNGTSLGPVTSPYTLTELTPGNNYTVAVQAVCGSDNVATPAAVTFFTPCVPVEAPFFEGFENGSTHYDCYTIEEYNSYGSIYPQFYTYYHHNGERSLYFYYNNSVVLQKVNLPANQMHVSFYVRATSSYTIEAGYVTDPTDLSTFVSMKTVTGPTEDWQEFEFYTDSVTAETIYITFRTPSNNYGIYLDDITIEQSMPCRRPLASQVDSATATSITLRWTPNGIGSYYEIAYATEGNVSAATIISDIEDTTAYTIEGLQPNRNYWLWVRTLCNEGSDTTSWHFVGHHRTACGDLQVPYYEDFSYMTGYQAPNCWTVMQSTNYYSNVLPYVYVDSPNYLNLGPQYQAPNLIAMPLVDLPANRLNVIYTAYVSSYYPSTLEAGYVTSLDSAGIASFVPLDTVTESTYTVHEFNTSSLPEGLDTIYIAFRSTSTASQGYAYISNVEVRRYSSCLRPSAPVVTGTETESIAIEWPSTGADGYEVRYSTSNNINSESVESLTSSDTTALIEDLTINTNYYIWVRGICGTDTSDWSNVLAAQTLRCEGGCILTIDMHDSYGDGWNGHAINVFVNGSQVTSATVPSGSHDNVFTMVVCPEDTLELVGVSGSYPDEVSYSITLGALGLDGVGTNLNGSSLFSYAGCPNCMAPTALTQVASTTTSIDLQWTPANDFDEAWVIKVDGAYLATVTGTPAYTLTSLTANTGYNVSVATLCNQTDTSIYVNLYASTDCPGATCDVYVQMAADYTNTWAPGNNYVAVYSGTAMRGIATMPQGQNAGEAEIAACVGDSVRFVWNAGTPDWGQYDHMIILNSNGDTLYAGDGMSSTSLLAAAPLACASCVRPDSVTVSGITATSAVVTVASAATSFAVTIGDVTTSYTGNPFTITGLNPGTNYTISVQANCEANNLSMARNASFATLCQDITSLPWSEGFAAYENEETPACWHYLGSESLGGIRIPLVLYEESSFDEESNVMYVRAYYVADSQYAITPMMPVPANKMQITFSSYFYGYNGVADAGIMTNPANPNTYIPLVEIESGVNEYEMITDVLSIADSGAYIAFRVKGLNENSQSELEIDSLQVKRLPNCQRPLVVTISDTTSHGATVHWNNTGASSYEVTVNGTVYVASTTDTFCVVTGLGAASRNEVKVRSNCGSEYSIFSPVSSFNTLCGAVELPFAENFDSYNDGEFPTCWTKLASYPDSYGNMLPAVYNSTYYAHSGNNSLRMVTFNNQQTKFATPLLDGPINNVSVSFWLYGSSSVGFVAGVMTDLDSTFIPLDTVTATTYGNIQYTINTNSVPLTDTGFYFVLQTIGNNAYSYSIYLDDLTVAVIPPCSEEIANIEVAATTDVSVTVDFTPGLGVNAGATYDAYVIDDNNNVVSSTNVTASPATVSGLQAFTNYRVYVALNCEGGVTAVSDTITFSTRCVGGTTVNISDSTSYATSYLPVYPYYNHSVSQSIYPDSLLGDASSITSIAVNCSTTNNTLTGFRGRIWLKEMPDSVITVDAWMPLDSMTLVYDGNLPIQNGWNEFLFSTPFEYSGNGNLMVCMMSDTTFGTYKSGYNFYQHTAPANATRYNYNDQNGWETWMTNNTTGYTVGRRADMRFFTCGNAVCDEPVDLAAEADETSITFNWTGEASNYEVAIAEEWNLDSITAVAVTDTFYTFNGLTAATTY
ncbi:MAG: fibronectin type III domain-containing protein, partial [Bacteroidales bacterium]|nr:fibronectin type III domain-containing protein [Bacteroidales bacterium]